jgi:hypothetical protein
MRSWQKHAYNLAMQTRCAIGAMDAPAHLEALHQAVIALSVGRQPGVGLDVVAQRVLSDLTTSTTAGPAPMSES